mmetsp:Transcript_23099/g.62663  ORF Transcript_23099/g.62663 Transcript_23099/m.62663 type:complete len:374 (-) Transcript_23099:43-1164(-)
MTCSARRPSTGSSAFAGARVPRTCPLPPPPRWRTCAPTWRACPRTQKRQRLWASTQTRSWRARGTNSQPSWITWPPRAARTAASLRRRRSGAMTSWRLPRPSTRACPHPSTSRLSWRPTPPRTRSPCTRCWATRRRDSTRSCTSSGRLSAPRARPCSASRPWCPSWRRWPRPSRPGASPAPGRVSPTRLARPWAHGPQTCSAASISSAPGSRTGRPRRCGFLASSRPRASSRASSKTLLERIPSPSIASRSTYTFSLCMRSPRSRDALRTGRMSMACSSRGRVGIGEAATLAKPGPRSCTAPCPSCGFARPSTSSRTRTSMRRRCTAPQSATASSLQLGTARTSSSWHPCPPTCHQSTGSSVASPSCAKRTEL